MVSQGTGSAQSNDDAARGMPSDTSRSGEKAEQVKEAVGQVKEQASKVTDKAKEQATTRADDQKERAAQGIAGFADALSQVSGSMREQNPAMANFADTAATRLEGFATSIHDKDVNELVTEVEDLARRQPALFIGGAFLAGVFAARFLKSSSGMSSGSSFQGGYGSRYDQSYRDYDTRGFSSQYGRPTGSSNYASTYGSTPGATGRSGYSSGGYDTARGGQTGGYRGGMTTGTAGGQDTSGAVRSGTGDRDTFGRGAGTPGSAASGQSYSPYTVDETTATTDPTTDRTRGTSGTSSSS